MSSIPVIKFMFRADLKVFNDALNIQPHYEVEDVSSANDLATYLSSTSAGLVIASLKDKNDLIQIATFLKISKKIAKDTVVKLVVLNFSGDKQYEKAIAKLGIQDSIEPGINTKALKFKLDFWMKSLNVQIRNNANAAALKTVKAAESNKAAVKKISESSALSWLEPLELENDIWILKHENDCKKVLSKWLIRLMGPSPYVGQWVEVKNSHWRFDFKESEKELFISGNGSWFFHGEQRPEFIWKENTWLITGDNFELYFKDESQIVSRLKSKDKNLTICKNSVFAKTKESLIMDSFDKELVFKREAENLEDLEGKNKTDKIDSGPLSGKNNPSENIDGNLSGKTEGEAALTKENHVQKSETEKKSSHWGGKNSNNNVEDEDFSGPKTDGPNSGPSLERERKDLDHQKYYKNHNEAQKYEVSEAKEREAKAAVDKPSAKGHLSGKSSTDEVEKNYDNSKTEREKKEAEAKDKELTGKSDTDKFKSHYGQKEKLETNAKEKEERDLDGKSSTDKLNSHYSNAKDTKTPATKQAEEKEKEAKTKETAAKQKAEREKTEAKERDKKEKEDREINERTKATVEKMQAKERERKEKEEQINKERSDNSQKNVAALQEKDKKFKEEIENEKEKNVSANNLDKEQKATRKSEIQEEDNSGKSKLDKNWEGEHDYGMKGESSTDKLAAHYKSKKEAQERKEKEADADPYAELFGKGKAKPEVTKKDKAELRPVAEHAEENANVLPLNKAREEKKAKTPDEKELDELTREAKVSSFLSQNSIKISCHLDDFFDETIIFRTEENGIKTAAKVNLEIVFSFLENDKKLLMQGDVVTVEGDGEGSSYITVKVNKTNADSFDTFMRLYEKRQANVNEFLKKVKGL